MTNFSTGRLGSELAEYLAAAGHPVTLLLGEQATWRSTGPPVKVASFSTTEDLRRRLELLAQSPVDALFLAAAVSDFGFGRVWVRSEQGDLAPVTGGKLSTRAGTLLAELVPTPKIIAELRGWYPQALLVGWKYEVEGGREGILKLAERQFAEAQTDACVVNGRAYGEGFGVVQRVGGSVHCGTRTELFAALAATLATHR